MAKAKAMAPRHAGGQGSATRAAEARMAKLMSAKVAPKAAHKDKSGKAQKKA